MKISFVTGNSEKVIAAKKILEPFIELEQVKLDIKEIQGDSLSVAIRKAIDTYEILKKPLIINDSSFVIPALNGFPGVYAKYVEETIGENILKLMENKTDRSAYYLDYLVYIDEYGYEVFETKLPGEILKEEQVGKYPFDRIFTFSKNNKISSNENCYDNLGYIEFLKFLKKRRVARGITIIDNKVLLFHRNRLDNGKMLDYYAIPGGGVESLETKEEACIRELKEETNIDAEIINYLGKETYEDGVCYYFETKYLGGEIRLGGEEKEINNPNNHYEIEMIDIDDIDKLYLYGIGLEMIKKVASKYQDK